MSTALYINDLVGSFLVAHPDIADNRFYKSVIYIVSDREDKIEGVVINKKSAFTFTSLLENVSSAFFEKNTNPLPHLNHTRVMRGGPVNNDKLFIIHSNDYTSANSTDTKNNILLSTPISVLKDITEGCGPKQASVYIGNCVWQKESLHREIKENSWFLQKFTDPNIVNDYLFTKDTDIAWEDICKSLGINQTNMSFFLKN